MEELESFLQSTSRQRRQASIDYAYFVVESFELIIRSLTNIIAVFNNSQPAGGDRRETWSDYFSVLQQLLDSCRSLESEWDRYIDTLQSNPYPDSYLSPIVHREHTRQRSSSI